MQCDERDPQSFLPVHSRGTPDPLPCALGRTTVQTMRNRRQKVGESLVLGSKIVSRRYGVTAEPVRTCSTGVMRSLTACARSDRVTRTREHEQESGIAATAHELRSRKLLSDSSVRNAHSGSNQNRQSARYELACQTGRLGIRQARLLRTAARLLNSFKRPKLSKPPSGIAFRHCGAAHLQNVHIRRGEGLRAARKEYGVSSRAGTRSGKSALAQKAGWAALLCAREGRDVRGLLRPEQHAAVCRLMPLRGVSGRD